MSDRLDKIIDEFDATRRRGASEVRPVPGASATSGDGDVTAADRQTLEAERAEFLAQYPFSRFWEDVERRAAQESAAEVVAEETRRPADRRTLGARFLDALRALVPDTRLAVGAAMAALVVAVVGGVWMTRHDGGGETADPGHRFKGSRSKTALPVIDGKNGEGENADVAIRFFVRDGAGAVPGEPGGSYGEGDQFRFTYRSGNNDFVILLSIEESGNVSVYYPDVESGEDAAWSVPLVRGRNIPLEGSVVLNDYVGKERFFALFSPKPLSVAHVRNAASVAYESVRTEGGGLDDLERLPIDVPQDTFLIVKR